MKKPVVVVHAFKFKYSEGRVMASQGYIANSGPARAIYCQVQKKLETNG